MAILAMVILPLPPWLLDALFTFNIVLSMLVILTTVIMAGLAVPLGPLLNSMPPLRAYSLDIMGSMAGIALFTALSAAWTSPVVWFSVVGVIASALGLANGLSRGHDTDSM